MKPTYQPDIYQSHFPAQGSRLVYGTSGLGGVWGAVNKDESIACLLYAFEHGISSLDTAPSYNRAEEFVGIALRQWTGPKPFISTKIGRLKCEDPFDMVLDYSPEGMRDSIKRSLDLLGVDSVDLLFLHEPHLVPLDRMDEILDTLKAIREEGLTKMIGVGGNPTDAFLPYIKPENFDVVSGYCKLDACNLSVFEKEMPQYLANSIQYYAASSLHFSLLGNRFNSYSESLPEGDLAKFITVTDVKKAKKISEIATIQELKLSTLAQRYLFSVKEASRIVMGARKIDQIEDTIHDWQQGALSQAIFDEITQVGLGV